MIVNEGTFARLKETAADAIAERNELREENAKLRELVADVWLIDHEPCRYHHRCNECDAYGSDCDCEYWERMRELGIEV